MNRLVGVYGAGGCGRGILPLLRNDEQFNSDRIVFIDDCRSGKTVNGHAVLSYDEFIAEGGTDACLAIADGQTRQRLDRQLQADMVRLLSIRAPDVLVMDAVEIDAGALLSPRTCLTSNIQIGRCFHANLFSYVEHDCVIGDYVTFAPRVNCNGNVRIGDFVYVGTGAFLRQGIEIGTNAVIGMGAVVTKDVPACATVVGNPARQLHQR